MRDAGDFPKQAHSWALATMNYTSAKTWDKRIQDGNKIIEMLTQKATWQKNKYLIILCFNEK